MHLNYQPPSIRYGWEKRTEEDLSKVLVNFADIELYIRAGGKNAETLKGYDDINVNDNDSIFSWSIGMINQSHMESTTASDENSEREINNNNHEDDTVDEIKDLATAIFTDMSDISVNTSADGNIHLSRPSNFFWPLRTDNCECWSKQLLSVIPQVTHHCIKNVPSLSLDSSSYLYRDSHSSSHMTERHKSCF